MSPSLRGTEPQAREALALGQAYHLGREGAGKRALSGMAAAVCDNVCRVPGDKGQRLVAGPGEVTYPGGLWGGSAVRQVRAFRIQYVYMNPILEHPQLKLIF